MEVIDEEPQSWFLLKEGSSLFLNAACEHSFIGYDFLVRLSANEATEYNEGGRKYLKQLSEAICYSAPIVKDSGSIYAGRNMLSAYRSQVASAIEKWRVSNDPAKRHAP